MFREPNCNLGTGFGKFFPPNTQVDKYTGKKKGQQVLSSIAMRVNGHQDSRFESRTPGEQNCIATAQHQSREREG
jgi:hypothetical protein